jgi:formylglycine-generating enzyme required for sulfatase activity
MRAKLLIAVLLVALPAGAVNIEWVLVGDPGNAPDTAANCLNAPADCGSVADVYRISKYELTNAQYVEFLEAVADADSYGLYNPSMSSDARGGITRSGASGSYSYAVKVGQGNNPVLFISWYDTLRFANWLHNGQPTGAQAAGTTEDGAYTFSGPTTVAARDAGAVVFLPTENEWYKAAYYDEGSATWFDYPMGTDTAPLSSAPPGNATSGNLRAPSNEFAVTGSPTFDPATNYLTDVGAYTTAASPYGTFDQGGNAFEWNETASVSGRSVRGGGWSDSADGLLASQPDYTDLGDPATNENYYVGFRVATVPEPGQLLLALTGGLVLAAVRSRAYSPRADRQNKRRIQVR